MLLSAVSVLVVAQSSSETPEGLMNNPVLKAAAKKSVGNWTWLHNEQICVWYVVVNTSIVMKCRAPYLK